MSAALEEWLGRSSNALDEIELLHRRVESSGIRGRALIMQVNHAYATLITAHFQSYCRAVHTEVAQVLVGAVSDSRLGTVLEAGLTERRHLDKGNPTPANLGSDFGRFDFRFWGAVEAEDKDSEGRRVKLAQMCEWRNAIVHGDISRKRAAGLLVPRHLDLETCKGWRRALDALAVSIDRAVANRCVGLGRPKPW
jgi:hypothetical protein